MSCFLPLHKLSATLLFSINAVIILLLWLSWAFLLRLLSVYFNYLRAVVEWSIIYACISKITRFLRLFHKPIRTITNHLNSIISYISSCIVKWLQTLIWTDILFTCHVHLVCILLSTGRIVIDYIDLISDHNSWLGLWLLALVLQFSPAVIVICILTILLHSVSSITVII